MSKRKCSECGKIFDSKLEACPNCGCPASECEPLDNESFETNETTIKAKIRMSNRVPGFLSIVQT